MRCFIFDWRLPIVVALPYLALYPLSAIGQPPPPAPLPDNAATAAPDNGTPPPALPAAGEPATAGVDVLTRGPVHEAYAEPVNLSGAAGPVISKRPPSTINENPADYRPDAASAVWIPGYWSWDDQQNNFIWVTGVWRIPPPGMQWISGYWVAASGGYQWTPGFWTTAETEDVMYYPQPPQSPEQGPAGDPPSPDDFWAPGCWNWQNNQFAWTNGYWTAGRPGWVWNAACYSWTPRGCVRVNGYWDYALDHRGLAFSPLAIDPAVYQAAGFSYTPSVAIDPNVLSFYLFTRPAWSQYYFGDYFAAEYDRLGIYPWYGVNRSHGYAYDPLFSYDHWFYRSRDPAWVQNLEHWHQYYRDHPEARPPHDLAAERRLAALHPNRSDFRMQMIGQPLSNLVRSSALPVKLARLTPAERSKAIEIARSNRAFETQRSRFEAGQGGRAGFAGGGPIKAALPHRDHAIVGPRVPANRVIGQASPDRPVIRPGETHREVLKPVVPDRPEAREVRPDEPPRTVPQPSVRQPNEQELRNRETPRPNAERPQAERPRMETEPRPAARHPQAPNFEPAHSEPHPAPAHRPEPQKPEPQKK